MAAADADGDGTPDLVAAGPGGGPHVRAFSGRTGGVVGDFFALDPDSRGGITVAAADLIGDGRAEVAVGAGVGGGPRVKVYDPTTWARFSGCRSDAQEVFGKPLRLSRVGLLGGWIESVAPSYAMLRTFGLSGSCLTTA